MCRPDIVQITKKPMESVPVVAKAYLAVYHGLPAAKVPFLDLDVAFTLLSATFLATVRFTSELVLSKQFGWPAGHSNTGEAAAGCTSICHSVILCVGLVVAFANQKYDVVAKLHTQNDPSWWPDFADAILQLCTGYMVYDTLIGVLWLRFDATTASFAFTPDDYLFLMHHAMTTFYMTSARVLGAGYMSAFICMLLGEMTNPLQNAWLIGKQAMELDCCNGPAMETFNETAKLAFAVAYFAVRMIIAPVYFANCTYHLLLTKKGRENIPLPLSIFWSMLIWGVEFGSVGWIANCYHILVDFATTAGGIGATQEL